MRTTAERVLIASRIYRPEPSAASLFLGSVADVLVEGGHEVTVLTARPPHGMAAASPGETVRTFPVLRDANGYVRGYVQYLSFDVPLAFRLLFARRPSLVFVEPPPTTGAVVRVICALRRIPYVYDAADIWSDAAGHATSSGVVVSLLRSVERFAMRGARAMVTISQGVIDRVRELRVPTAMTVTGFGADTSVFRYDDERVEPVFIYAGTHTELHGADILIEAFAILHKTHPNHRLLFIGNGTGQDRMRERAAELGLASHVEFRDPVSPEDLRPQLSTAVASLATLHPEGGYGYAFASKTYSSLASGCPVIFAGPGPTADFMRDSSEEAPVGVAVDYDAEAIAEVMREAAESPLPSTERRRLAMWTAKNHSMRAVAQRVRDVLLAVARGEGTAA